MKHLNTPLTPAERHALDDLEREYEEEMQEVYKGCKAIESRLHKLGRGDMLKAFHVIKKAVL